MDFARFNKFDNEESVPRPKVSITALTSASGVANNKTMTKLAEWLKFGFWRQNQDLTYPQIPPSGLKPVFSSASNAAVSPKEELDIRLSVLADSLQAHDQIGHIA